MSNNTNTTVTAEQVTALSAEQIHALPEETAVLYMAVLQEQAETAELDLTEKQEAVRKAQEAVQTARTAYKSAKSAKNAEAFFTAEENAELAEAEAETAKLALREAFDALDNFQTAYNLRFEKAIACFRSCMINADPADLAKRCLSAQRANRGTAISVALAVVNPARYTGTEALKLMVEDVTTFMELYGNGKGRAIKGNCADHNTLRGAIALAGLLTGQPVNAEDFYSALTKEK